MFNVLDVTLRDKVVSAGTSTVAVLEEPAQQLILPSTESTTAGIMKINSITRIKKHVKKRAFLAKVYVKTLSLDPLPLLAVRKFCDFMQFFLSKVKSLPVYYIFYLKQITI